MSVKKYVVIERLPVVEAAPARVSDDDGADFLESVMYRVKLVKSDAYFEEWTLCKVVRARRLYRSAERDMNQPCDGDGDGDSVAGSALDRHTIFDSHWWATRGKKVAPGLHASMFGFSSPDSMQHFFECYWGDTDDAELKSTAKLGLSMYEMYSLALLKMRCALCLERARAPCIRVTHCVAPFLLLVSAELASPISSSLPSWALTVLTSLGISNCGFSSSATRERASSARHPRCSSSTRCWTRWST